MTVGQLDALGARLRGNKLKALRPTAPKATGMIG